MAVFTRTKAAKCDLIDIWHYTADRWGIAQADRYVSVIHTACHALARGELSNKPVAKKLEIRMARCQHHYLIYIADNPIRIIGVLHKKMDIMTRVTARVRGN